jgi:ABC-2 type transport system permease protein
MATNLNPAKNSGALAGFWNMLKIEGSPWLSPRILINQILAWFFATNLLMAITLIVIPIVEQEVIFTIEEASVVFIGIFSQVLGIGSIIAMQSVLVGEKQSGTAAWIMSNPITRTSFILSKLVANALGILFVSVVVQGAIGYGILSYAIGYLVPVRAYLVAMGLQTLHTLFYITLTLALGSFLNTRGPIMGIGIFTLMGLNLFSNFIGQFIPWFPNMVPETLKMGSIMLLRGVEFSTSLSIIATSAYILIFIGLAIWRFKKTEF